MTPVRPGDTFTDAAGCRWVVRAVLPDADADALAVAVARPGDPEAVLMTAWEWEAVVAALTDAADDAQDGRMWGLGVAP